MSLLKIFLDRERDNEEREDDRNDSKVFERRCLGLH